MNELIGQPSGEILKELVAHNDTISHFFFTGRSIYSHEGKVHKKNRTSYYPVPKSVITPEITVNNVLKTVIDEQYISCLSRVLMTNGFAVIPMLDYQLKDVDKLKAGLMKFKMPGGYIVDSGSGLHYWGIKLIDECGLPNYVKNLSSFHALDPAVDNHWIPREPGDLMELRIDGNDYKPTVPKIIDIFNLSFSEWIEVNKEYQIYDGLFLDLSSEFKTE